MGQFYTFHRKWFGERPVTEQSLGEALFLENDYWERMKVAVNNGILTALK
ncbi:DUF6890 family protein [Pseudodesulfovibrio profundus]